jgi:hypothetical protein
MKTVRKVYYTIFNFGTPHSFNPDKKVYDWRTNTERTLLDIHVEKVVEANNRKLVYILDHEGAQVDVRKFKHAA